MKLFARWIAAFVCAAAKRDRKTSASLIVAAMLAMSPVFAYTQTPPPVRFVSGDVFSGVGHGDRIPGAAAVITLAVGDFDHDGNLDLITTNSDTNANGLGLVLGNGDGTFQAPVAVAGFDIYGSMGGVVASDFNHDGNLDFAATWALGGPVQVGIYLGDGLGHFTFNKAYSMGTRLTTQLAAVDVNGDGNLDLIVPDPSNYAVAVFYGKGDGTFPTSAEFPAGITNISIPTGVAVADLNRDGKPDIVVAASTGCCPWSGGIGVLLNNGNGTFKLPAFYSNPSGVDNGQVAIADLNADTNPDVVLTSNGSSNVGVFLASSTGNGTFATGVDYWVPWASSVAIGDVNGDKKPDLVVSAYYDGCAWVLINKGKGIFQAPVVYSTDWPSHPVALADFNGDKKLDFVMGNGNGQYATIALGNGDGTFQDGVHYGESFNWTNNFAVADFNLDGYPDVVQAGGGTGVGLSVMLGSSHGVLGTPTSINLGASQWARVAFVLAGDVDGDGKPDIVSSAAPANSNYGVVVMLGLGTGKFKTPVTYKTSASSYPAAGVLADVNGDGKLDILTSNYDGSVSILLNKGKGVYGAATVMPTVTGTNPAAMAAGDFNGDGKLDVALTDYQRLKLVLLFGNGNGTFQTPVEIAPPLRPNVPVVGDFNKDSKLDLAILSTDGGGSMAILRGNGNGTFTQTGPIYYFYEQNGFNGGQFVPNSGAVVDLNADGNLDLAIAPGYSSYVVNGGYRSAEQYMGALVYLGKGDGTFVQQSGWLAGPWPAYVAAADFNADGMPDLVYESTNANYSPTMVTVLLNSTRPVSVSPLSVAFVGIQYIGTSKVQTVILTNDQSTKLTIINIGLTGANMADYSAKSTCGSALGPGLHCTITVTFKPLGVMTRMASLVIKDDVGTQTVPLTGTATEVKLTPASLNFGSVTVGQPSTLPVTLTNVGTSAMAILSPGITITGAAPADFSQTNTCGTSVGAGQSCTITVTFKPLKTGARSATLNINDNGGPSPQKVPLSGKGV